MLACLLFVGLALVSGQEEPCGLSETMNWQDDMVDELIVGGVEAPRRRYPWQISLEACGIFGCSHSCGAVLIGKRTVLTAAHCVGGNVNDYQVILGLHRRGEISEGDRRVKLLARIKKHPGFVQDGLLGFPNDIAVLRLSGDAPLGTPGVGLACLPESKAKDYTTSDCWISGWGRLSGNDDLATDLQHAQVDVYTLNECLEYFFQVDEYHICIHDRTSNQKGACNGDSGGPLNCRPRGGQIWDVAGLTSWGIAGCDTSYPSVYVRVSYYIDWIIEQALLMGDDTVRTS